MPGKPKQDENLLPLISNAFWAYKYNVFLLSLFSCFFVKSWILLNAPTSVKIARLHVFHNFYLNSKTLKKHWILWCFGASMFFLLRLIMPPRHLPVPTNIFCFFFEGVQRARKSPIENPTAKNVYKNQRFSYFL